VQQQFRFSNKEIVLIREGFSRPSQRELNPQMKPNLAKVFFLVLALTGCQQKSDIDKCVEAQAISWCNSTLFDKTLYKLQNETESQCKDEIIKTSGGKWQLECLKAKSGK